MYIAITLRYDKSDNMELLTINKKFKEIFNELNITLIPIMQTSNLDIIVKLCDGLILTGSPYHVNPSLYGMDENIYNFEDDIDYCLIKKFYEKNKPIVGICRGIQVINVYFGGTLKRNIINHERVNHMINIMPNTLLSNIYSKRMEVNSTHTQAVDKVADGFLVSAVSDDGVVEAIEKENIIAVQWHPEKLLDKKFFEKVFTK